MLVDDNGGRCLIEKYLSELYSTNKGKFESALCSIEDCIFQCNLPAFKKSVIIMRGLPGSGKTYVVKHFMRMEKEKSISICSTDGYFRTKPTRYQFSEEELTLAQRSCLKTFIELMGKKRDVIIVDNCHSQTWEYQIHRRIAKLCGYQCFILQISCHNEITRQKYERRCTRDMIGSAHEEMFKRWQVDYNSQVIDLESKPITLKDVLKYSY